MANNRKMPSHTQRIANERQRLSVPPPDADTDDVPVLAGPIQNTLPVFVPFRCEMAAHMHDPANFIPMLAQTFRTSMRFTGSMDDPKLKLGQLHMLLHRIVSEWLTGYLTALYQLGFETFSRVLLTWAADQNIGNPKHKQAYRFDREWYWWDTG